MFLRSTISIELKNVMLSHKTKLRFWDLKCQRCPIDDIGVLVYHVMADCCSDQKFSSLFSFSMKVTDEFISKFKFVFVQIVCDVIYSASVFDHPGFHISYFNV